MLLFLKIMGLFQQELTTLGVSSFKVETPFPNKNEYFNLKD
jgi:hypothetical protein